MLWSPRFRPLGGRVLRHQSSLRWQVIVRRGTAIGQVPEGSGSVIMKDDKLVGTEFAGKTLFKFASGTLTALSGKTVNFTNGSTGLNRFEIVFTAEH